MASTITSPSLYSHMKTSISCLRLHERALSSPLLCTRTSINRTTTVTARTRYRSIRGRSVVTCSAAAACSSSSSVLPSAPLFDCDGILIDTEKDGHRISFNDTFAERELDVTWDVDLYGELLKIGVGKERMTAYFNKMGWPEKAPKSEEERKEFVASLHKQKTALFMALIEKKLLPLQPGVAKLIDQALAKGVKVAVCSTSNEKAVSAIVSCLLGPERAEKIKIFARDVVPRKKPDPLCCGRGQRYRSCSCQSCWKDMYSNKVRMQFLTALEILLRNGLTLHSVEAFLRSSVLVGSYYSG